MWDSPDNLPLFSPPSRPVTRHLSVYQLFVKPLFFKVGRPFLRGLPALARGERKRDWVMGSEPMGALDW
jgi:hypothetical protein